MYIVIIVQFTNPSLRLGSNIMLMYLSKALGQFWNICCGATGPEGEAIAVENAASELSSQVIYSWVLLAIGTTKAHTCKAPWQPPYCQCNRYASWGIDCVEPFDKIVPASLLC